MQLQLKKPDLERFIDQQVKSGHFPSPEAVVENALLRMMEDKSTLTPEDLHEIKLAEVQIQNGQTIEFSEFAQRMRQKFNLH